MYPSDLTEAEWALVAPLLPAAKPRGRPRSCDVGRLVNGLFSGVRTGCAWRALPREEGAWGTVEYSLRHGRLDGTWAHLPAPLRELARLHAGRDPPPSAALSESQSVQPLAGGARGLDGAKQRRGRNRHLLVDTQGVLLAVVVHPAHTPDRAGGKRVLAAAGRAFPRLRRIGADHGYTGTLVRWAAQE